MPIRADVSQKAPLEVVEQGHPRDLTARDLMTQHVLTLEDTGTVDQALSSMREHHVRHLPVMRHGAFIGLVDDRLVALGHLADGAPRSRLVADLMTHYVPQVAPDADLTRVARLIWTSGCDAVVVVDEVHLLGIITASDIVAAVATWGAP